MATNLSRRHFLGSAAAAGTAGFLTSVSLPASAIPCGAPTKFDETVDTIVIGAGGGGLAAAVAAAQHGVKNIVILEKMPFYGGNTQISGGGFNSVDPVRQGRQKIKDSPELHAKNTLNGGDNIADPALVKRMTENSYAAITWLQDMGMKFKDDVYQIYGGLYPRCHAPFGSLGSDYIKVLIPQTKKYGIEIRLKSRVCRLFREGNLEGKVIGLEYVDAEGKHKTMKATRCIVVATGGFGANPEMRSRYDPRFKNLTTTNLPCSTGDLIPISEDIGADVTGMDFIQCNPGCPPGRTHRVIMHLYAANFIMVGPDAKRFVAEDSRRDVIRDAILALPKQTGFSIVDERGFEALNPGHQAGAKKGLQTGDAWTANTIEELAKKMGLDPKALRATIDEFNAGVDAKKDKMGKAPRNLTKIERSPFWACYAGMSVHHTMGGLRINTKSQVIDRYNKPIEGLYAVGEVTGGIHGTNRLGGNAICDIFSNGRLTGIIISKL
ncbi:MAG: flavocytochrome c [Sutterellaceae bacterium]|nr:flavocytochrome c [Sutterellaceae bacterium]MDY2868983.1 flavocytochrome c [Mesosutterella sp.]